MGKGQHIMHPRMRVPATFRVWHPHSRVHFVFDVIPTTVSCPCSRATHCGLYAMSPCQETGKFAEMSKVDKNAYCRRRYTVGHKILR